MKTEPIVPAELHTSPEGLPFSREFDDIYHPHAGAFEQARHVFLGGNGLPERWRERDRFVVLETGFGLGNNFLATWEAWRADPQRSQRLVFVSIEKHPLRRTDLQAAHARSPAPALAAQLVSAWPPLSFNLHRLLFEGGQLELLLALGDAERWLPELVLQADAFFLDGFAPAKNPQMWQPRVFKALARLAAPEATAATWTAASAVRQGLASAGFEVRKAPGQGGKRDITLARYAPAFTPRHAPARSQPRADEHRALVIGAGLAGAAVAQALQRQQWSVTVLDRADRAASAASGNPAGLFHGVVNPQDGHHARFNRAAALSAQHHIATLLQHQPDAGRLTGLLRLETTLPDAGAMRAVLTRLGLPDDYVSALAADEAAQRSGLPLRHPAWHYPGGGWVRPAAYARWMLQGVDCRLGHGVDRLERDGAHWVALDAAGRLLGRAPVVVLANAGDALRLLGLPGWPVEPVRGQLSLLPAAASAPPHLPVAGAGYLLPPVDGRWVFGATHQAGDQDLSLRPHDDAQNLAQLQTLLGHSSAINSAGLEARAGLRWVARDRLPLIGAVPDRQASATRPLDQARWVPRQPGLFVCTALASRGITWCALGGEVLASLITGSPVPLEASLLDAIDPTRFLVRAVRQSSNHGDADQA